MLWMIEEPYVFDLVCKTFFGIEGIVSKLLLDCYFAYVMLLLSSNLGVFFYLFLRFRLERGIDRFIRRTLFFLFFILSAMSIL